MDDPSTAPERDDSLPPGYMPIDATGGKQPILLGLAPLEPGVLIAERYRLLRPLSRLGVASRWEARDELLSRSVTVLSFAHDYEARFILEASREASAAMDARVLRILDAGHDADGAYIISEWAEGRTLTEILSQGPLSSIEAAWVTREVATAMASCHPLGLFHLCINPSNVTITSKGSVKISGLMIESALTNSGEDKPTGHAEMEALDVKGCGRILYACLTAQWPGAHPVAGMKSVERTEAGLPAPSQLFPGASPALNKMTYQILSLTAPGHLASPAQIVEALDAELGSASGVAGLARRVEALPKEPEGERTEGERTGDGGSALEPTSEGGAKRPVFISAGESAVPTEPVSAVLGGVDDLTGVISGANAGSLSSPVSLGGDPEMDEDSQRAVRLFSNRQVRQWSVGVLILVGLVVVAIITAIILLGYRSATGPSGPGAPTGETTLLPKIPVTAIQVFDPVADVGDENENNDMAPLAIDGDPVTGWQTYAYEYPTLDTSWWGMGVGLLLDLETVHEITSVTVSLKSVPATIGVYIPLGDPAVATAPPMDSLTSWTQVGQATFTTPTVTIPVTSVTTSTESPNDGAVSSRYVIVYVLRPAETSPGVWSEAIMEIEVR